MNYLNGVKVGGIVSPAPAYGAGRRQMRRLIFLWLKYVVGWVEVSKVGTNWDNPVLAGAADGATHVSDPKIFNSATGGFSGIDPASTTNRYQLLITGFSDPTRDGFYVIKQVITDNQVWVDVPYCGVHTDGLPLSETLLTWRVEDFKDISLIPAIDDEWYLRGTGIGGSFQLHCDSNNDTIYSPDSYRVSPDDGANWTAFTDGNDEPWSDAGIIFGVADATHAYFWVRWYQGDFLTAYLVPDNLYFGDIVAFRPANDLTPVVAIAKEALSDWGTWTSLITGGVRSLTASNVQIDERALYPTIHGNSVVSAFADVRKLRSYYSGRFIRAPIVIASIDNAYPEVRGYLKSVDMSHQYGDRVCTPFGTGRDRLRIAYGSIPWNGSKQYNYVW